MPVSYGSIVVGKCFATPNNDVRKVLGLDGESVTYVVRGKMAFPSWDPAARQTRNRDAFAKEVSAEVPDDWHAAGAPTL
ncbi:MAG: hypothetical protein WDN31_19140 [Hyphomicrobium sp.]